MDRQREIIWVRWLDTALDFEEPKPLAECLDVRNLKAVSSRCRATALQITFPRALWPGRDICGRERWLDRGARFVRIPAPHRQSAAAWRRRLPDSNGLQACPASTARLSPNAATLRQIDSVSPTPVPG